MAIEFMTVKEVASYLKTSTKTIQRLVLSGKLPAIRLGKQFRIDRKDLEEFIEKQKIKADDHS